mgnify:CR=1 FL=1
MVYLMFQFMLSLYINKPNNKNKREPLEGWLLKRIGMFAKKIRTVLPYLLT